MRAQGWLGGLCLKSIRSLLTFLTPLPQASATRWRLSARAHAVPIAADAPNGEAAGVKEAAVVTDVTPVRKVRKPRASQ